jgi:hypothetical protein
LKALIDYLKENRLYGIVSVKEVLIRRVANIMDDAGYRDKYGISGSFSSTEQTISIVVGLLSEQQIMEHLSGWQGLGEYGNRSNNVITDYVYGINITGINDDEVKSISSIIYNGIVKSLPIINAEAKARVYGNIVATPASSVDYGSKRFWLCNLYLTAGIGENIPIGEPPVDGDNYNIYKANIGNSDITTLNIKEYVVSYVAGLFKNTEYDGAIDIVASNTETVSNTSVVIGISREDDHLNSYNGVVGANINMDRVTHRHERIMVIGLHVFSPDNDALWIIMKYLSTCLQRDSSWLSGAGIIKLVGRPSIDGIQPVEMGAEKKWRGVISARARAHNLITIDAEIC